MMLNWIKRLFACPELAPAFPNLWVMRDEAEAVISERWPHLVDGWRAATGPACLIFDTGTWLKNHFPDHDWGPENPYRTADVLRNYQGAVA